MGLLDLVIGIFVVILVLVVFMQPLNILRDEAQDSVDSAGTVIKYGTDTEGNVVAVGSSSAFPSLTTALMYLIGLGFVAGVVVWIIRFGRSGYYQDEVY